MADSHTANACLCSRAGGVLQQFFIVTTVQHLYAELRNPMVLFNINPKTLSIAVNSNAAAGAQRLV